MKQSWDQRIARAHELSQQHPSASELLDFYGHIAVLQKSFYDDLQRTRPPAGLEVVIPRMRALLKMVAERGPRILAQAAAARRNGEARWREILTVGDSDSDPADAFFAKALLQPYTEYLASRAAVALNGARPDCPFCGEKPVVAILRGEGDGAKRSLVCSLCSTEWDFRRILCPGCGEENKDKLPVYTASDFDYVRVEACESCRTYIKSIDFTKNGRAVAVVDELASAALDVWADGEGYGKLQPNLLDL